jgi:hypothetical protein
MKAVFIAYNQAYGEEIVELLDSLELRGFTQWIDIQGRGMAGGEPHYGNHAWPTMNYAMLTIVPDDKVDRLLSMLKGKDLESPDLGLRAFSWNIEQSV